ncbi:hypothetical protein B4U80_14274 [Leptotrombidium deliense]|uniref:Terpene synthase n=1 Tax=Leptotrombidium deliense TaxID=299467 RepID=A0A443RYV9_9ACAR|nr:hypothetical protein B4U80_14274 [Leptotrombidium deliense]
MNKAIENNIEYSERDDPIVTAVIEVTRTFCEYSNGVSIKKMKNLVKHFLSSLRKEKRWKRQRMAPKLCDYKVYRYYSVGFDFMLEAMLNLQNVSVPQNMQCTQSYSLLCESANTIAIMLNDIASFRNELHEHSKNNMVIVLKQERGYVKYQDAIDEMVQMLNDEWKNLELLLKMCSTHNYEMQNSNLNVLDVIKQILHMAYMYTMNSKRYTFANTFTIEIQ